MFISLTTSWLNYLSAERHYTLFIIQHFTLYSSIHGASTERTGELSNKPFVYAISMEAVLASQHFKLIGFVVVDEADLAGLGDRVQLRAAHLRDVLDHHRCVASPMLIMSLDDDRKDGLVQQSLVWQS
jgi:hypothetical protein